MTHGVQVVWPDENGNSDKPDEIEFFHGIDVNNLDQIPQFTMVTAVWPKHEGGTVVEYSISTHCKRPRHSEVHLVVHYERVGNEDLVQTWGGDIGWGKNTIILKQGENCGKCHWRREDVTGFSEISWNSFDLGANKARPHVKYFGSRREARFRDLILNCDEQCCVLTGEPTVQALDAAHLVPAANGENDLPFNGILLRADLHRLFDAGLFTFKPNGKVKLLKRELFPSDAYVRLLRNARLPSKTLRRVRDTLVLPEFQIRCK